MYPENHHDVVKVRFGISNSDSYYSLRIALLKKLKLPSSGEFTIKVDEKNPIDFSVLAFVRIFKMNEGRSAYIALLGCLSYLNLYNLE